MTGRGDTAAIEAAIHQLPMLARRFATAMAADIEGDVLALYDFAQWAAISKVRVHALAVLANVALGVAGWSPDDLRAYAMVQEGKHNHRGRS